jgi:hypothetical protein
MAQVLTYSPSDVTIHLCGYQLGGLLSVEVTFNSRPMQVVKGIRGNHTRVSNDDTYATVRIEVAQTSITNDILSEILLGDTLHKTGRLKFSMSDLGGTSKFESEQGFIPALPPVKYSMGFESRTWEIELLKVTTSILGGNPGVGFDVFSSVQNALSVLGGEASQAVDNITSIFA